MWYDKYFFQPDGSYWNKNSFWRPTFFIGSYNNVLTYSPEEIALSGFVKLTSYNLVICFERKNLSSDWNVKLSQSFGSYDFWNYDSEAKLMSYIPKYTCIKKINPHLRELFINTYWT